MRMLKKNYNLIVYKMERKTITRKDMTPEELKDHKKALQRKNSNNYYRRKKEAEDAERMAEVSDNTDEEGEDKPKVSKPKAKPKPKVAKIDKLEEKIDMLMEMIQQLQEGTLDDEEDTEEEEDEEDDDDKKDVKKVVFRRGTSKRTDTKKNKTLRKKDMAKMFNDDGLKEAELFLRKNKMLPQLGLYEQAVRDGLFV